MKNLQNNFTTYEQSKRLLELGVPADSTDCIWWSDDNFASGLYDLSIIPYNKIFSNDRRLDKNGEVANLQKLPCWSVGRLMEICKLCEPKKYYEQLCEELQYSKNYCVVIISHIIANLPIIDFSKLDE